jgi:hypothetical protein
MKILIGSPVYQRSWILPKWFECIENQSMPLEDIGFIFELGPNDDETHQIIWDWHMRHPEVAYFDAVIREDLGHYTHPDGHRTWTKTAYYKMVDLRNSLLEKVSAIKPEKYFSLDSDLILEDTTTLEKLYHSLNRDSVDAVSPLSYMFPKGTQFPSVMTWIEGPGKRASRSLNDYKIGSSFKADVIMAAVMMNPDVYTNVRYIWHPQGEDLGWSSECQRKGYNLYCISDIYVPHIMHKWMLEQYGAIGDPRKEEAYNNVNTAL